MKKTLFVCLIGFLGASFVKGRVKEFSSTDNMEILVKIADPDNKGEGAMGSEGTLIGPELILIFAKSQFSKIGEKILIGKKIRSIKSIKELVKGQHQGYIQLNKPVNQLPVSVIAWDGGTSKLGYLVPHLQNKKMKEFSSDHNFGIGRYSWALHNLRDFQTVESTSKGKDIKVVLFREVEGSKPCIGSGILALENNKEDLYCCGMINLDPRLSSEYMDKWKIYRKGEEIKKIGEEQRKNMADFFEAVEKNKNLNYGATLFTKVDAALIHYLNLMVALGFNVKDIVISE